MVDADTRWGEVFDALTTSEQECIREKLDSDSLESVLDLSVLAESETAEAWEILIFSCLAPQTARALFLSTMIAAIGEAEIIEIDADVVVCLGEWVAELDVFTTMVAPSVDGAEAMGDPFTALMTCSQDLVVVLMLEEAGLNREELSEEEASCLRAWVAETDWTTLPAGSTDGSVWFDILPGLLDCVPDLLRSEPGERPWAEVIEEATPVEIGVATHGELDHKPDNDVFAFEADEGEYYQLDVALGTLQNSVLEIFDADGTRLGVNYDSRGSRASRLTLQAPGTGTYYVQVTSFDAGTGTYTLTISIPDVVDDDPNSRPGNATPVEIGVTTQGALDYEGDSDYFAFEATEGELYQLDVALGTLQYSILVDLFDADGAWLGVSGDSRNSTASRLISHAPTTGTYYVMVTGRGTGIYTFTISIASSDIVDDHPNSTTNATPVEIGVTTQGALDYEGDSDYFAFQATEGAYHQLDVTLGTLQNSMVVILDARGAWLGMTVDDSTPSRLISHAPTTGTYYIRVTSPYAGTGTYTVAISDIVDDHPNSTYNATPAEIGLATQGALDYEGDVDYFAFEATEGASYQLDVTLGTLEESVLYLLDADGTWLDITYGDSPASQLIWQAPTTGTYYILVTGAGTGTYTLTIAIGS